MIDERFRWSDAVLAGMCAAVWPRWYGWTVFTAWLALEALRVRRVRRLLQEDTKR